MDKKLARERGKVLKSEGPRPPMDKRFILEGGEVSKSEGPRYVHGGPPALVEIYEIYNGRRNAGRRNFY
jgi:hypothetical protein